MEQERPIFLPFEVLVNLVVFILFFSCSGKIGNFLVCYLVVIHINNNYILRKSRIMSLVSFIDFIHESVEPKQYIRTYFGQHSLVPTTSQKKMIEGEDQYFPQVDPQIPDPLIHHYSNFDRKHAAELRDYTDSSHELNKALWDSKGTTANFEPHLKLSVQRMDLVVKHHKTPHPLTVYTGLKKAPIITSQETGPTKENLHHHPAYLSTSLHPKIASEFAAISQDTKEGNKIVYHHHILKINVPKEHPGAYVEKYSAHPEEKEFILPRNTKLHIYPNPKIISKTSQNYDGIHRYHYWNADIGSE